MSDPRGYAKHLLSPISELRIQGGNCCYGKPPLEEARQNPVPLPGLRLLGRVVVELAQGPPQMKGARRWIDEQVLAQKQFAVLLGCSGKMGLVLRNKSVSASCTLPSVCPFDCCISAVFASVPQATKAIFISVSKGYSPDQRSETLPTLHEIL